MSQIIVLMVVDVEAALASGNLQGNIYLVDNNGPQGSKMEGNAELQTACHDGDTIVWWVSPVDPATNVSIASFGGQAVPQNINPVSYPDGTWHARVETNGNTGTYQYTATLSMDGKQMTFDPFLIVS